MRDTEAFFETIRFKKGINHGRGKLAPDIMLDIHALIQDFTSLLVVCFVLLIQLFKRLE